MNRYEELCTPLRIGTFEIKNRIVMSPMGDGYSTDDGSVTEEMITYYGSRARSGAGLIIIGTTSLEYHEGTKPAQHAIFLESHIKGLKRLAESVHRYGTHLIVQLCHAGRQGNVAAIGHAPYAPSAVAAPGGVVPIELSVEQIKQIQSNFINAAVMCRKAGVDGVELHGGNGYLINEFLTPHVNRRGDEYGGSLENRTRFLREIIAGIREKCGNYPISVRLSVEEGVEDGLFTKDACEIARLLEGCGVDMINVSAGLGETQHLMMADARYPQGFLVPSAAEIKKHVSIPVAVAGRIRDFDFADRTVAEGKADMLIFGRPFNADPNFPRKFFEGREDEIRPCLSCGLCHTISAEGGIRCSFNPTIGLEQWYTEPCANGAGRRVVVVGGGPAGCEAARTLASRGFAVTLFEGQDRLGGQVNIAAKPPHKEDMNNLRQYYSRILPKLGIDLRLGARATLEGVRALEPYAVVLASGSRPFVPPIPGADGSNVTTAQALLMGEYPEIRDSRVVVAGIGDTGMETAMWLLERGNTVVMADMIDPESRLTRLGKQKYAKLKRGGMEMYTGHRLVGISESSISFERLSDGALVEFPIDHAVMSLGVKADRELLPELSREYGDRLLCVGDVKEIGQIREAVFAGFNAGWYLDRTYSEIF